MGFIDRLGHTSFGIHRSLEAYHLWGHVSSGSIPTLGSIRELGHTSFGRHTSIGDIQALGGGGGGHTSIGGIPALGGIRARSGDTKHIWFYN